MLVSRRTKFDWPELHQSLSRGKSSLLIARSLMVPELLILDEATSGLTLFAASACWIRLVRLHRWRTPNYPLCHPPCWGNHCCYGSCPTPKAEIIAQGPKGDILQKRLMDRFYPQPVELIELGRRPLFHQDGASGPHEAIFTTIFNLG